MNSAYIIQAAGTARGAWQYSETSPDVLQSTKKNGTTVSEADPTQQFAFIRSDNGNYYIYSIAGVNSCIIKPVTR